MAVMREKHRQAFELSSKCLTHSGIQLPIKVGFLSAWKCSEVLQEQPELSYLMFPEGIQPGRLCPLLTGEPSSQLQERAAPVREGF